MITSKQRAFLKSKSHNLNDIVFIGKEGLTENVYNQIKTNLFSHELIKIKVQQSSDNTPLELANTISSKIDCEIVSVVGRKIVLYKRTEKEGFKHYL